MTSSGSLVTYDFEISDSLKYQSRYPSLMSATRKTFTVKQKLEILDELNIPGDDQVSKNSLCTKYNITREMLCEWSKNKSKFIEKLESCSSRRNNLAVTEYNATRSISENPNCNILNEINNKRKDLDGEVHQRIYSLYQKGFSQQEIHDQLHISHDMIQKSLQRREQCENNSNNKKKTDEWPLLEEKVLSWISQVLSHDHPITQSTIINKAIQIAEELNIEKFIASEEWIQEFMNKNSTIFSTSVKSETASSFAGAQIEPTLTIKACTVEGMIDGDIVRIDKNMLSRLLYPNPVCLLSVYSANEKHRNVMTITWLTPVNNQGGLIFSVKKSRYTAQFISEPGKIFVLNIPSVESQSLVLAIGSCTGADIDKFQSLGINSCLPGWQEESFKSSLKTKKKLSKKKLQDLRIEQIVFEEKNCIAISNMIAHCLCQVTQVSDSDDGDHWIIQATQLAAWCKKRYWNGKNFIPSNPPYMTFLGSKTFGIVSQVATNGN